MVVKECKFLVLTAYYTVLCVSKFAIMGFFQKSVLRFVQF